MPSFPSITQTLHSVRRDQTPFLSFHEYDPRSYALQLSNHRSYISLYKEWNEDDRSRLYQLSDHSYQSLQGREMEKRNELEWVYIGLPRRWREDDWNGKEEWDLDPFISTEWISIDSRFYSVTNLNNSVTSFLFHSYSTNKPFHSYFTHFSLYSNIPQKHVDSRFSASFIELKTLISVRIRQQEWYNQCFLVLTARSESKWHATVNLMSTFER